MGEDVLRHLGMLADQAKRAKLIYQQEDEALVRELAASFFDNDEKGHVLRVQQQMDNLANVLSNDQHIKQYHFNNDSGWDDDSLVKDLGNKNDY